MKDIKYTVTLARGCRTMKFVFDDMGSASSFAKMAVCNSPVEIGYDGETEKFWASVDLMMEEEGDGEDD